MRCRQRRPLPSHASPGAAAQSLPVDPADVGPSSPPQGGVSLDGLEVLLEDEVAAEERSQLIEAELRSCLARWASRGLPACPAGLLQWLPTARLWRSAVAGRLASPSSRELLCLLVRCRLEPQQVSVVELRHGLDGEGLRRTWKEVGECLGRSGEQGGEWWVWGVCAAAAPGLPALLIAGQLLRLGLLLVVAPRQAVPSSPPSKRAALCLKSARGTAWCTAGSWASMQYKVAERKMKAFMCADEQQQPHSPPARRSGQRSRSSSRRSSRSEARPPISALETCAERMAGVQGRAVDAQLAVADALARCGTWDLPHRGCFAA